MIMESGKVMRSSVDEVSLTGRTTQGVTFTRPDDDDRIIGIARNAEAELEEEIEEHGTDEGTSDQSEMPTDAAGHTETSGNEEKEAVASDVVEAEESTEGDLD